MKCFKLMGLWLARVTMVGIPLSSHAVTLTAPYYQGEVSLQWSGNVFDKAFSSPTIIDVNRSFDDPDFPTSASTSYSLLAAPLPGFAATSSVDQANTGATGFIGYQFSIVGPAGLVPVTISFNGGDTISGYFPYASTAATVEAAVSYVLGTGGESFSDAYSVGYSNFSQVGRHTLNGVTTPITSNSFNATDSVNLTANAVYGVSLQMGLFLGGTGTANVYVDPLIQIAPGFANASQYSIELSPGIGNSVAAVPEPSTCALMLVGLSVLGMAWRPRMGLRLQGQV